MIRARVIPTLLLHKSGLVKSVNFKNYRYVGDPINAVKIFNEKEVDEIAIFDIDASRDKRQPDTKLISKIVSEAFMPLSYGGGITSVDQMKEIFQCGVEKIIINSSFVSNPSLVSEASKQFGSQSVVVSIDVKRSLLKGYSTYSINGTRTNGINPVDLAVKAEKYGAGEILLNNIDRDGTYKGFDLRLIKSVSDSVKIPVVAVGGASSIMDFKEAIDSGASAVAAGSIFVFQRPHNAVLITYPSLQELDNLFNEFANEHANTQSGEPQARS